jgi:hypothetical protein
MVINCITQKREKYLISGMFILSIIILGCSFYSKDDYLKGFNAFIIKVEADYKTYSDEDWENKELEYQEYINSQYKKFKEKLTDEDVRSVGKLKGKYQAIKIKYEANKYIDKAVESINQLEGIVEGVIESINNQ